VTIGDRNSGATDTLTITLTGSGLVNDGGGVYTLAAASPTSITSELDALSFTPVAGTPTTIAAGNANDTVNAGPNSTISLGNGNDTVTAGANSTITLATAMTRPPREMRAQ
jgi:hypothetical protein